MIFWHYANAKDKNGYWITDKKFNLYKNRVRERIHKKRNNPRINQKTKDYAKEYYLKNKERFVEWGRNYYENNREKIRNTKNRYKRIKMGDPVFALKCRLRVRIRKMLKTKNYRASAAVYKELGCDKPTLIKWFEQYFNEEMNWDTFKDWHIDHKIPLITAKNEEELIKLCHYTNLQPMMARDNMNKGIKII